jgi:hypothetical protein
MPGPGCASTGLAFGEAYTNGELAVENGSIADLFENFPTRYRASGASAGQATARGSTDLHGAELAEHTVPPGQGVTGSRG